MLEIRIDIWNRLGDDKLLVLRPKNEKTIYLEVDGDEYIVPYDTLKKAIELINMK